MFFTLLCFLLVAFLFRMSAKCGAKVPYSVPKRGKAVTCLEEICVLDELHSGMTYSGRELKVNESTIYIE